MHFAGLAAAFLAVCALANLLVDPAARWGSPLGLEPATLRGDRRVVERLRTHRDPIDALIIGLSHSFSLHAEDLSAATGLQAFNAASAGARVETMCAVLRYVAAQSGTWPRLLIVGADVGSFYGELDTDIALTSDLGAHIPYALSTWDRVALRGRAIRSLFEIVTVNASLRSMQKWRSRRDSAMKAVLLAEAGEAPGPATVPLDPKIVERRTRHRAAEYGERYQAQSLDPRRVQWFSDLVREAAANGSEVILYLTPLTPRVDAGVRKTSNYAHLLSETWGLLRSLERGSPRVTAVDCSTIDKFGGRAEWFVDGVHGTRDNGRAVIRHCLAQAGWHGPAPHLHGRKLVRHQSRE